MRAIQEDAGQPARGNHDGGVLKFGPDGKQYIFIGDVGRRGQLQNLPCGPTPDCPGATVPNDQFGGLQPDDALLTGVTLRLNDDGTTPALRGGHVFRMRLTGNRKKIAVEVWQTIPRNLILPKVKPICLVRTSASHPMCKAGPIEICMLFPSAMAQRMKYSNRNKTPKIIST